MKAQLLCERLRASRGFAHKRDIAEVMSALQRVQPALAASPIAIGDDCAAIPLNDGSGEYLLFAMEGFVEDFVEKMPWFAGYCGVMVNVSDIAAMGGRPVAVVDALWSNGADAGRPILEGLSTAATRYGVPVVGGHSNHRSQRGQLAVAIVGRARRLLTSFDAQPGDELIAAIDLRGHWQEPYPYWNASTDAPASRLRDDIEILAGLAEDRLCCAAKDISMAGTLGTLLMLFECSGVGGTVDVDRIPRPPSVGLDDQDALVRWLTAFPSYGFVLSVNPANRDATIERFARRGITAEVIGKVEAGTRFLVELDGSKAMLWDHASEPFIGAPHSVRRTDVQATIAAVEAAHG